MRSKRALVAVGSFFLVHAWTAVSPTDLRAQEGEPMPEMRELLKNLPQEFEKFARRHPLPPPKSAATLYRQTRVPHEVSCWEDVASDEEWIDSSERWERVAGTVLVCSLVSVLTELSARKR